jgi:hypothetical protein
MYAMLGTRPDIAYAVGRLGRFSSDPSREHWMAACGVLMYLKHTRTLGIEFSDGQIELDGFSDADFATSDPSRRRVTSGYCFRLWGGPISWQSKRQPSSLATGDAEYVVLALSCSSGHVASLAPHRARVCTITLNQALWRQPGLDRHRSQPGRSHPSEADRYQVPLSSRAGRALGPLDRICQDHCHAG